MDRRLDPVRERHYGERYELAAKVTGYDAQTLMNMFYVASRFEISRRREKLSFSRHAAPARGLPRGPDVAVDVETKVVCPQCGHLFCHNQKAER